MPVPPRSWLVAIPALLGVIAIAAAACGPLPNPPQPPEGTTADPATTGAPETSSSSSGDTATTSAAPTPTVAPTAAPTTTASASTGPTSTPLPACKLPEPKKSADACKTDADCDVSDPCHAHACVAKAKAHPPEKSTVCTRKRDCLSVDANPCGCLEGVCALIPPK